MHFKMLQEKLPFFFEFFEVEYWHFICSVYFKL